MVFSLRTAAVLLFATALTTPSALASETTDASDAAAEAAIKSLKLAEHETVVFVEDLHCATCAKKVTRRLFKLKGVTRVRTSVKLDAAVITPQAKRPLDPTAAWAALQEIGYQPTRLVGPDGVFVPEEETLDPVKVAEAPTAVRK